MYVVMRVFCPEEPYVHIPGIFCHLVWEVVKCLVFRCEQLILSVSPYLCAFWRLHN